MIKTLIRFGLLGAAVLIIPNSITCASVAFTVENFAILEVLGYASMALAMIAVFFGIRSYRDGVGEGSISFGRAVGVGTLIALVAALLFGIYTAVMFETFYTQETMQVFKDHYLDSYKASGATPEMLETLNQEMNNPLYSSGIFQGLVMLVTVMMIGMPVTLVSALILRRRPAQTN